MSTEVALIEITNPLVVFSTPKGLDAVIDKIESEAKSIDRDISTPAGRENIRSLAFKLAKSKKEIERMATALTEEWRDQTKLVNAEKNRGIERMQSLQDEIRKPLTEYEEAEKNRVNGHELQLSLLSAFDTWEHTTPTAEEIKKRIADLPEVYNRDWQEFSVRAKVEFDRISISLADLLSARQKADSEAADLARLRAAEDARLQAERDAKIAKIAKEATEAAEKAAAEKASALAADVAAKAEAAEKAKSEALERAEKAEAAKLAAEDKARTDALLAAQKATQDEKARAAAVEKADSDAKAAREADKAHKEKIHNDIMTAILKTLGEIPQGSDRVKGLVVALAKGEIPHVKITY